MTKGWLVRLATAAWRHGLGTLGELRLLAPLGYCDFYLPTSNRPFLQIGSVDEVVRRMQVTFHGPGLWSTHILEHLWQHAPSHANDEGANASVYIGSITYRCQTYNCAAWMHESVRCHKTSSRCSSIADAY